MSYTAPTTRTTGTLITAAIWNTDLVDDIAYLYSLAEGGHNGWIKELDSWVYVSANSFKITGKDVTSRFAKGTKLKCTDNSTTKYFYVASSSFSTDTTVTITAGSDFTLAGGAITAPYYSYGNPPDFPDWFNFNPSPAGYSANPTSAVYKFFMKGKIFFGFMKEAGDGTSNATTKAYTLPVASAQSVLSLSGTYKDNGVVGYNAAILVSAGSATLNAYKPSIAAWTSSGACSVFGTAATGAGAIVIFEF